MQKKVVDHFVAHSKHKLNSLFFYKKMILIIQVLVSGFLVRKYISTRHWVQESHQERLSKIEIVQFIINYQNKNQYFSSGQQL